MEERMDWMNIARYFYLTDERLQQISRDFAADMERALLRPARGDRIGPEIACFPAWR
jgi:hypothetical protein